MIYQTIIISHITNIMLCVWLQLLCLLCWCYFWFNPFYVSLPCLFQMFLQSLHRPPPPSSAPCLCPARRKTLGRSCCINWVSGIFVTAVTQQLAPSLSQTCTKLFCLRSNSGPVFLSNRWQAVSTCPQSRRSSRCTCFCYLRFSMTNYSDVFMWSRRRAVKVTLTLFYM